MADDLAHIQDAPLLRGDAPSRIAIVLPGLSAGGTEHVVSMLAGHWVRLGHQVMLITFEAQDAPAYYPLDPRIRVCRLGLPTQRRGRLAGLAAALRRVALLRAALRKAAPDMVLSFLTRTNVMVLAASLGLGLAVVVSERNNPVRQDVGPVWRFLRARLYPRAFGLVTMTAGAMGCFPATMRRRSWVIPNAVDLPGIGPSRQNGRTLTAVGRLVPQKGFDLLLDAFAQAAVDFPDWKLVIWGEGTDRALLEAHRDRLGLAARVAMPGVSERPGAWIETADIFVLSSRFEGWGIVLLEAMAAGLPVVSFDCRWGPAEMIEDGHDGLLVPAEDVGALAGALRRVMAAPDLRTKLGGAAGRSARRFTRAPVLAQWDSVVRAVMARNEERA